MSRPRTGAEKPTPRPNAAATSPARANEPVSARTKSTIPRLSMPMGMRARTAAPSSRATSGARSTRAKRCTGVTEALSGARGVAAVELELVGAVLESGDDEGDVLVEVHAELLGAGADLVAVDGRGEARLLELLLDGLGRQPVDALGAHVGAGQDEAAELVDRVERLLQGRIARDAQEVGVRGDGPDDDRVDVARLQLGQRDPRVAGLEVGVALVIHVVQEADDAPQLLVLAVAARVGAHRRLDGHAMAAQGLRLDPFAEKVPGLVARKLHGHGC